MIIESISLSEGVISATMTAYIQENYLDHQTIADRPAIIICPGGAYLGITEKEAEPVALRFVSAGYQAFVLRYSIGAELARFPAPFLDAAKAVMTVRKNAAHWCVHPNRITLCGFSTGGQIAAFLGATWQEDYLRQAMSEDSYWYRPDALLLCYPLLDMNHFRFRNNDKTVEMNTLLEMMFGTVVGTGEPDSDILEQWNPIFRVTTHMPPTFLWTTAEDSLLGVDEALNFVKALARNHVPYEFHLFEKGAHGLSLGDEIVGYMEEDRYKLKNSPRWIELALNWMKDI